MTNNEIRAALLKEFDFEIQENNELFLFVKWTYESYIRTKKQMDYFQELTIDLNKTIQKRKLIEVRFENNKQSFWNGFGKLGLPLTALIIALSVFEFWFVPMKERQNNHMISEYENLNNFIIYEQQKNPKTIQSWFDDYSNKNK
jgi:hypothetical protein